MTDYDLVKSEIASFIGTSEQRWNNRTRVDVESAIRKGDSDDQIFFNPLLRGNAIARIGNGRADY